MKPEQIAPQSELNNENETPKPFIVLKHPKVFSYFRELSVVIIGVLTTLLITSLISDYNRQKELAGMMRLVKDDLTLTLETLRIIQYRWEGEQYMFGLLRQHVSNIEEISSDTLKMYSHSIGAKYSFTPEIEAYEVLRSSTLAQYFKDKELMTQISRVYKQLYNLQAQLTSYTSQKTDFFNSIVYNMDIQDAEKMLDGDIYDLYRIPMENKGFRSFLVTGTTILSGGIFDSCVEDIEELIRVIEEKNY